MLLITVRHVLSPQGQGLCSERRREEDVLLGRDAARVCGLRVWVSTALHSVCSACSAIHRRALVKEFNVNSVETFLRSQRSIIFFYGTEVPLTCSQNPSLCSILRSSNPLHASLPYFMKKLLNFTLPFYT
jgi:hypothetical protein